MENIKIIPLDRIRKIDVPIPIVLTTEESKNEKDEMASPTPRKSPMKAR